MRGVIDALSALLAVTGIGASVQETVVGCPASSNMGKPIALLGCDFHGDFDLVIAMEVVYITLTEFVVIRHQAPPLVIVALHFCPLRVWEVETRFLV